MNDLVYIGVGSNIDPERHIPLALEALAHEIEVTGSSTFYWSEPEARNDQPCFLNGVWAGRTDRSPHELKIDVLRKIEHDLGRRRNIDRHAARCIDLDLLLHHGSILVLPDPQIANQTFVSVPLLELDPGLAARFAQLSITPNSPELRADEPFTRLIRAAIGADTHKPSS